MRRRRGGGTGRSGSPSTSPPSAGWARARARARPVGRPVEEPPVKLCRWSNYSRCWSNYLPVEESPWPREASGLSRAGRASEASRARVPPSSRGGLDHGWARPPSGPAGGRPEPRARQRPRQGSVVETPARRLYTAGACKDVIPARAVSPSSRYQPDTSRDGVSSRHQYLVSPSTAAPRYHGVRYHGAMV